MKLRLAGTVNRLNVEHRTSKIERPKLMTLRFIDFKTSKPQNFEGLFRSRRAGAPAAHALARRVRGVCAACCSVFF
jgi:hypothetical protein